VSFEVFVQCFDSGEPAGLDRAEVRQLFPVAEDESEPNYWLVRYDALNSCHIRVGVLPSDPGRVDFLNVHRPCEAPALWAALLAVLRMGTVILYWPGLHPPLAATKCVAAHLPRDLLALLGRPEVVSSVEEIVEAVRLS
jgi:hypothetical protein